MLDDDRTYLCSISTMYRILAAHDEVRERRRQLRHPEAAKPQLVAYLKQQKRQTEIQRIVQDLRTKADVKVNLPDAPAPTPAP